MLLGLESAALLISTGIERSVLYSCDLGDATEGGAPEGKDLEC